MKAKRLKESGLCLASWVMKVAALNSTEQKEKTTVMSADTFSAHFFILLI